MVLIWIRPVKAERSTGVRHPGHSRDRLVSFVAMTSSSSGLNVDRFFLWQILPEQLLIRSGVGGL
jgi:hypothetical protein